MELDLLDDDYVLQMTTALTWKTNRQSTPVLPTLNPVIRVVCVHQFSQLEWILPMPIEYSVLIMDLGSDDRLYQRQPSFYIVIDCILG